MTAAVSGSRPLDPAERYFCVLGRLMPMNIVAAAELSEGVDPTRIEDACRSLSAARAITRARLDPHSEGWLVAGQPSSPPVFSVISAESIAAAQAAEHELAFDAEAGPLVRCAYAEPAAGDPALLLTIDHSLGDAKTAIWLLQDLLREIESGGERRPEELPAPLHACLPAERRWRERRKEMVALLRQIGSEQTGTEPADEIAWHRRHGEGRRTAVDRVSLEPEQTAALRERARGAQASVQGMLGAAWLGAAASLVDGAQPKRLALTSPADLRPRFAPPVGPRAAGMYITLLMSAHRVAPNALAELAAEISSGLRRRLDRGEGELFYELTRASALPLGDQGADQLKQLIAAAPQAIAVSNVGVINDYGDPQWVRSISFSLAPTPNQAAFAAATTYRGRLAIELAVDETRTEPGVPRKLAGLALESLRR